MRTTYVFLIFGFLAILSGRAQVKIGDNPQNIDPASVLELESSSRVLVISRMSGAQMNALTPLRGALVFNTDSQCIHYYDGTQWINLCEGLNGTTNESLTIVDGELVLTDSEGNSVSVTLESLSELTFSTDAIENANESIIITQNGNNYNFEVGQITGEDNIVDGSINGFLDIQFNSISADQLAPNSVGQEELQDNTVADLEIDYSQVTLNDFTNDAGFINSAQIISPEPGNSLFDNNGAFYDDSQLQTNIADNNNLIGNHISNDLDLSDQNEIQDASEVDVVPNGNLGSDNVQAALVELQGDVDILNSGGANTDEQNLNNNPAIPGNISIDNGNTITINVNDADSNPTNEIQNAAQVSVAANPTNYTQSAANVEGHLEGIDDAIGDILAGGGADGVITNITTSGNNLVVTGAGGAFGGNINLEPLVDNAVSNNGFLTAEVDGSVVNEAITNAELNGNILEITEGGNLITANLSGLSGGGADGVVTGVTLSGTNLIFSGTAPGFVGTVPLGSLDTTLDEAAVDAFVNNNGYLTVELDDDPTNEIEIPAGGTNGQVLATDGAGNYSWATVGGGGLDTNDFITGGVLNNESLELTGTGGAGAIVDLSDFALDTDLAGFLTTEADGDPANEIQTLSIAGSDLTISGPGGNTVTLPAAGAPDWTTITNIPAGFADDIDDDTQLDEAAVDAFVANNGYLTAELDDDPANEIQTLSIAGSDLTISGPGGNTVTLPAAGAPDWTTITNIPAGFADDIDDDTQLDEAAVDAFVANNGYLTAELDDDPANEIQTLSIAGSDLTISGPGGNTVTLPAAGAPDWTTITNIPAGFADDIDDDTQLDEAAVDAFVANNGYLTAELDDDPANEIQTLSIAGSDLTISGPGGNTVTLPAAGAPDWTTITNIPAGFADDIDDDTQLDEAAVDAFVANNGYLTAEADGDPTNEIQTLSIAGSDLTISGPGGNTVTLPAAGTADWTTITNIPAGFADDIDDDTQLDEAAVDAFVANNGYLTAELDDDPANEIQTLSIAGSDLTISGPGGNTVTLPAAGAPDWTTITNIPAGFADDIDDDTQLDEAAVDAFVANNGYLTAELDDDPANEIQTLSIAGSDLTISGPGGNTVTLPAAGTADWTTITNIPAGFADDIDDDTQLDEAAVDAFVANNGYLTTEADGDPTNEIQTLSIAGSDLTISGPGGNTVTLPGATGSITSSTLAVTGGANVLFGNVTIEIAPNGITQTEMAGNSVGTGEIQPNAISTFKIANGAILNEDINASAAIDGSKVNPVFTSQINATAGMTTGADILMNGNTVVPDFVFQNYFDGYSELKKDYRFKTLEEIEAFVKKNKHLPGVTSLAQAKKDGHWNLSQSNLQNLEKIEELFLHTIEQEKKIKTLQEQNQALNSELLAIKKDMAEIKALLKAKN
ncbi:hypothetical protein [Allomuricauda sp. SCSIO 65647]|uniref:hypothetical protein n=1 Tax=Allomuricauda sp. SCSIO 65647 TaxID=2908843 RepID=UPI001F355FEC|nr:hypothetical protein [Muricauda sp. SCSIO 65647]UJH68151.1 hypothetical protein L0P89_02840 [Muricauda sp. SCSIO 65647]